MIGQQTKLYYNFSWVVCSILHASGFVNLLYLANDQQPTTLLVSSLEWLGMTMDESASTVAYFLFAKLHTKKN